MKRYEVLNSIHKFLQRTQISYEHQKEMQGQVYDLENEYVLFEKEACLFGCSAVWCFNIVFEQIINRTAKQLAYAYQLIRFGICNIALPFAYRLP